MKKFLSLLGFSEEKQTTVRTEIIAGKRNHAVYRHHISKAYVNKFHWFFLSFPLSRSSRLLQILNLLADLFENALNLYHELRDLCLIAL